MFADYVKMAAKMALIAVITGAIIVIFTSVSIPGLDFTTFSSGVSSALGLLYHWVPASTVIVPVAFTMMSVYVAILLFEFAMIAVRWVFKINE